MPKLRASPRPEFGWVTTTTPSLLGELEQDPVLDPERAVVDDHDLDVGVGLGGGCVDRLVDVAVHLEVRDHDRYQSIVAPPARCDRGLRPAL